MSSPAPPPDDAEALAPAVLARPPRRPRAPELFTSGVLFGQPGLYPEGPPMDPAPGPPPDDDATRALLAELLAPLGPATAERATVRLDEHALVAAAPDLGVRAALVALTGTVGQPVLDGFPHATTAHRLGWGEPASPGRVVGPPAATDADADTEVRVVNERYRAEHPALVACSLVHDLLWRPTTTGHAAEATLHALVAMIHVQLVARLPRLAHLGTELARRQASLSITLLNSRHPGDDRISLIASDGVGTIPGGAPELQSPDLWSIPFGPTHDDPAPDLLGPAVDQLVDPAATAARPDPLRFDDALGTWLSAHLGRGWLSAVEQLRAAVALGLVDLDDVTAATGLTPGAAAARLRLEPALRSWVDRG